MSEIFTTSEQKIDISNLGITKKDIIDIKNEKSIDNENRIIIGLIIGRIRKKFFELQMDGVNFQNKEIQEVINLLELPLEIKKEFNTFEQLGNHIFTNYDFNDIKSFFLSNEIQVEFFLKGAKKFLNYNFNNTNKKIAHIINSIYEL